jgi:BON domain
MRHAISQTVSNFQDTSPHIMRWLVRIIIFCSTLFWVTSPALAQTWLNNPFNDPFIQLTRGLNHCATAIAPRYTAQEFAQLNHERTQRGVSCWLAGRCRLMSSYAYDAEIAERVQRAIAARSGFENTTVWMLGQRRHIWLKGCVNSEQQGRDLAKLIRQIDDVEGVFMELNVGANLAVQPSASVPAPVYATEAAPVPPRAAIPLDAN